MPRVIADPFGSFLSGKRQAEQDELALIESNRRERRAALEEDRLAFQNALDREFGIGDRSLAQERIDIQNQAASLDIALEERFGALDRISQLNARDETTFGNALRNDILAEFGPSEAAASLDTILLRNEGLDRNNTLDAIFLEDERSTALQAARLGNETDRLSNDVRRRFGAAAAQADLDASRALADQRRRPPQSRTSGTAAAPSAAVQRRLDIINGSGTGSAAPATQQSQASAYEFTAANGGEISPFEMRVIASEYTRLVEQNPANAARFAQLYPNLYRMIQQ